MIMLLLNLYDLIYQKPFTLRFQIMLDFQEYKWIMYLRYKLFPISYNHSLLLVTFEQDDPLISLKVILLFHYKLKEKLLHLIQLLHFHHLINFTITLKILHLISIQDQFNIILEHTKLLSFLRKHLHLLKHFLKGQLNKL